MKTKEEFGYEEENMQVWIWKLNTSYSKISEEIEGRTNFEKRLTPPIFQIIDSMEKWGTWNPGTRKMSFSLKLLNNFEWGAVEHVMRHEMAHQIVSEIFNMDCYGVSHGSAWKIACAGVNIDPDRCSSYEFLSDFKGTEESPMVDRVRKIIIKANDSGATKEEAEIFMQKAKELMLRHDIEMKDISGEDRLFVLRPFGGIYKRFPAYLFDLATLLQDHYDVRGIKTYGPRKEDGRYYGRLELFGEPDKLDIAEYVGHALLNQAEILYEQYKNKTPEERMELGDYGRPSKKAFFEGLIDGFHSKLNDDREAVEKRVAEKVAKENAEKEDGEYIPGNGEMVPTYDKQLLKEMYHQEYPNLRSAVTYASRAAGGNAGRSAGKNLSLAKGVRRGSGNGGLLGS